MPNRRTSINSTTSTKHLCFVYIGKYKCLKDVSICLDDRYEFNFDANENVLTIRKNEKYIEHLWGKDIYSLSAIVGENGVGKSTTIRYILEMTVEGVSNNLKDSVLVLEEDENLMVYSDQKVCINNDTKLSVETLANGKPIYSFFYSTHFALPNGRDITCNEWSGMYNGSDKWKIINDFQSFSNVSEIGLSCSLQNHIIGYNAQNEYRVTSLLANQYGKLKEYGLNPPKYAMILPNESGLYALPHKWPKKQGDPYKLENPYERINNLNISNRNKHLYLFIHYIILNVATNGDKVDMNVINQHKSWAYMLSTNINDAEFDQILNQALKDLFANDAIGHEVKSLLEMIYDICSQNRLGTPYLDLENYGNQLLCLISKANSLYPFVTARFFDIAYSHDVEDTTLLSSGELEMLNLYSRIYDAVISRPSTFSNIKSPNLILLDEAEIGYHPEWQRKFVKNIVSFLNSLGKGENFFQVVLTSHSPIILSDIPRSCTNYLTRGKPIPTQETFGANIFDLYRNSFFMSDGFIGEFAKDKITELIGTIKSINNDSQNDMFPEIETMIEAIGDPFIREQLHTLYLSNRYKDDKAGEAGWLRNRLDNINNFNADNGYEEITD